MIAKERWAQALQGAAAGIAPLAKGAAGRTTEQPCPLRQQLAVRGWVDPTALLPPDMSRAERTAALDALAADVEVRRTSGGSQWYLRDEVRRAALRSLDDATLDAAIADATGDPIALALCQARGGGAPGTPEEVRLVLVTSDWLGERFRPTPSADELRQLLPQLTRREDYVRLTRRGVYGRDDELDDLHDFLVVPTPPGDVRLFFLHGGGGMGKSTLLAKAMLRLLDEWPDVLIVQLDFDRSDLDPTNLTTLDLELLRQLEDALPEHAKRLAELRSWLGASLRRDEDDDDPEPGVSRRAASRRESMRKRASRSFRERGNAAESSSLLYGQLSGIHRRLVILADTFEQVEAAGAHAVSAAMGWLRERAAMSGLPDVRGVVSGRIPPVDSAYGKLHGDLRAAPLFGGEMRLRELEPAAAAQVLRATAPSLPEGMALDLVKSLPRDPLTLRLCADVFSKLGSAALAEALAEARDRKLPPAVVQGLLYDRILKHVEERAKPFAHPGLALPQLDRRLIRDVLAPVVTHAEMNEADADAVFKALASATWLVSLSDNGSVLTQRKDMRKLMLRLMAQDPLRSQQVEDVHRAAAGWHERHSNQAAALYHRLMLVRTSADLAPLRDVPLEMLAAELRPWIDDLPNISRSFVRHRLQDRRFTQAQAAESLDDESYRAHHERSEGDEIRAEKLLAQLGPRGVVDQWRNRPWGDPRRPPISVIEAMARSGGWVEDEIDVDGILGELRLKGDPSAASARDVREAYWIARLALLANPTRWSQACTVLLADLQHRNAPGSLVSLPSLAVVAQGMSSEPFSAEYEVALATLREGMLRKPALKEMELAGRVVGFALESSDARPRGWKPPVSAIRTLQADWHERMFGADKSTFTQRMAAVFKANYRESFPKVIELPDRDELRRQQDAMDLVHQSPYARIAQIEARKPISLPFNKWRFIDRNVRMWLLRGKTPEFHEPLRHALFDALSGHPGLDACLERFHRALTICPRELEPVELRRLLGISTHTWWGALVVVADEAKVLESLIVSALEARPDHQGLQEIHRAWLAWDRALTGGRGSNWWGKGLFPSQ